jgi:hypothetical protein
MLNPIKSASNSTITPLPYTPVLLTEQQVELPAVKQHGA